MEIYVNELFHARIIETSLLYKGEHYRHAALESMKQVEMALRENGKPDTPINHRHNNQQ